MRKIILASIRDIRKDPNRSFLVVVTYIIIIAFPIAFMNIAPSLNISTEKEIDTYNLSDFDIRLAYQADIPILSIIQNVIDSYNVSYDWKTRTIFSLARVKIHDQWIPFDIIGLSNTNTPINDVILIKGKYPQAEHEALLHESVASEFNIEIGDNVTLYGNEKIAVTIVGLARSIEYVSFVLTQQGAIFVNESKAMALVGFNASSNFNSLLIKFNDKISTELMKTIARNITTTMASNNIPIIAVWFQKEISYRKGIQEGTELISGYMTLSSIFVILIGGFVSYIISTRYVQEQKRNIGVLYSFGYGPTIIVLSFITRTLLLGMIGSIIGIIAGQVLLSIIIESIATQWGLIEVNHIILNESIIFVLIVAYGSGGLFTIIGVSGTVNKLPISLLRRTEHSFTETSRILKKFTKILPLPVRFAFRNLFRNRGRLIVSMLSMALTISFSISLLQATNSTLQTTDSYFSTNIRYEGKALFVRGFPIENYSSLLNEFPILENNFEPYFEYIFQVKGQETFLAFARGFQNDTSLYTPKLIEGRWMKNNNEIVLSQNAALTTGLKVGDPIAGYILGRELMFTIVGIAFDAELLSSVFLQIDVSRAIFDVNGTIANGILIKDAENITELIDELNKNGEIRSAFTNLNFQARAKAIINSQTIIVFLMAGLGVVVTIICLITVIYVSLVDREHEFAILNAFGVSSFRIFFIVILETIFIISLSFILGFSLSIPLTQLWLEIINSTLFFVELFIDLVVTGLLLIFIVILSILSTILVFKQIGLKSPLVVLKDE